MRLRKKKRRAWEQSGREERLGVFDIVGGGGRVKGFCDFFDTSNMEEV